MSDAWADPQPRPWSSGAWSLELRGDELAEIRFDGSLVLRSIRAVARDRDWNTVPVAVTEVTEGTASLELALRMTGFGADIDAVLRIEVAGDRLLTSFAGRLLRDFERNRLGLIVLHPPSVAGAQLTVISPDGAALETAFPERIAPHQPALDIAGLRWRHDGVAAELDFTGEVFEMEDQRNWTDASFKTYSTPLALPFPVALAAGDTVEQSLELRCRPVGTVAESRSAARPAARRVPAFALGASTAPGVVPSGWMPPADAILVELETHAPTWPAALDRAVAEAGTVPLDVRITAAEPGELDPVLDAIAGLRLVRLGVFSPRTQVTEPELWDALRAGAASRGIPTELLGGARSHFTELNRTHGRLPAELPALTFAMTPQMHAIETAQVVESIGMQRLVAEDAVRIAGGRPVHVGPVTLRSRYNTVATTPPPVAPGTDLSAGYGAALLPSATDPRQRSPELAAWLIASAAALAVDGVASITFFETWGPRGLVAANGEPYPVATAAGWLHEIAGCPALEPGPLPSDVWAIGAETPGGPVLLIANLRPEPVELTLVPPFAGRHEVPALGALRLA